jgi:hypothetical protein
MDCNFLIIKLLIANSQIRILLDNLVCLIMVLKFAQVFALLVFVSSTKFFKDNKENIIKVIFSLYGLSYKELLIV